MKKLIFLLMFCVSTTFAVDYDTTQVYIYTVNIQQDGAIQHYATAAGVGDHADQQLSLIITQMKSDGIDSDSIRCFYTALEFILADGNVDTCYAILNDIQDMNPVADTLSESWFDIETWKTIIDAVDPYYEPL